MTNTMTSTMTAITGTSMNAGLIYSTSSTLTVPSLGHKIAFHWGFGQITV